MRFIWGVVFLSWVFLAPALLKADESYEVHHVPVDVTSESAMKARTQALSEAHLKAFQILLEDLVDEEKKQEFKGITAQEIEPLVQDFEIVNERLSTVRYIATLNFRFNPTAVQHFLERGVQGPVQMRAPHSGSSLIIPIFIQGDQVLLWEEKNPWFTIWSELGGDALATLEVPLGDLDDVSALTSEDALEGDSDKLKKLLRRYGASTALVTIVRIMGPEASLEVIQHSPQGQINSQEVEILGIQEEGHSQKPSPDLWKKAVKKTIEVSKIFAQEHAEAAKISRLEVVIPFTSYKAWRALKAKLESVPSIHKIEVARLSRQEALVHVTFQGTRKNFDSSLASREFLLVPLSSGPGSFARPQSSSYRSGALPEVKPNARGRSAHIRLQPRDVPKSMVPGQEAAPVKAGRAMRWKLLQRPRTLDSFNPEDDSEQETPAFPLPQDATIEEEAL